MFQEKKLYFVLTKNTLAVTEVVVVPANVALSVEATVEASSKVVYSRTYKFNKTFRDYSNCALVVLISILSSAMKTGVSEVYLLCFRECQDCIQ